MIIKTLANAKINLTLDITGRRDDGYHLIETIMQSVDLCDEVTVKTGCKYNISVISDNKFARGGKKNIAYKAAAAFFDYTGAKNPGIEITLKKSIPVAAGMAGGSADGAAVIMALDKIIGTNLSSSDMCEIGLKVGADLPFCITGGTMLAQGIGEKLTPLFPMPDCTIVVAKPDIGVSTAKAYELIDSAENLPKPNTQGVIEFLKQGNINGISSNLCNVFENALGLLEVADIRKIMSDFNCLGSLMSGSGSSVYGLFDNEEYAQRCVQKLKQSYNEVYLCHPAKQGVVLIP